MPGVDSMPIATLADPDLGILRAHAVIAWQRSQCSAVRQNRPGWSRAHMPDTCWCVLALWKGTTGLAVGSRSGWLQEDDWRCRCDL